MLVANPCSALAAEFLKAAHRNGMLVSPELLASNAEAQEYVVIMFSATLPSADASQYCANLDDQEVYRGRRIILVVLVSEVSRKYFRSSITAMTIWLDRDKCNY